MIEGIIGEILNAIASTIGSTSVTRFFKHEGQVGIVRSLDKFKTSVIRGRATVIGHATCRHYMAIIHAASMYKRETLVFLSYPRQCDSR